jgi:hypothetical protein
MIDANEVRRENTFDFQGLKRTQPRPPLPPSLTPGSEEENSTGLTALLIELTNAAGILILKLIFMILHKSFTPRPMIASGRRRFLTRVASKRPLPLRRARGGLAGNWPHFSLGSGCFWYKC